jgi:hypothetical protein
VGARRDIRRERHLAHIELEPAHHAPECLDDGRHLLEFELETGHPHGSILDRAGVSQCL